MKRKISGILFGLMFLLGFAILIYPTVSNQWNTYRQNQLISSYEELIGKMAEEDFDAVIAANLKGTFCMMHFVSRQMLRQRSGKIINLASVVGICGNAGQVNYAASKAGVIGMTKSAAKELASRNITVNAVAPGWIETDMTKNLSDAARERMLSAIPLKKPGTAKQVAGVIAFLASEDADYITGQVLQVDGGMLM